MKPKFKLAHMSSARAYAECSSAVRLKVGAIIVKNDAVISIGVNGTPPGWDNVCEQREYWIADPGSWYDTKTITELWPFEEAGSPLMAPRRYKLVTRPEVIHAEANALDKLCKHGGGADGADMFITHAPCLDCAKRISNVGIKNVYYAEEYRDRNGLDFLSKAGVNCELVTNDV